MSPAALGDFLLICAACGLRPGAEEVTPKKSLYEDLLTPEELEAERERKKLMELEISLRLARDKTLSQTRAVMKYVWMHWSCRSSNVTHTIARACSKVSSFQTQAANAIELLDSDSDDDAVEIIDPPQQGTAPSSIAAASAAVIAVPAPSPSVRGERIKLHVRSNGGAIDEIAIHMVSLVIAKYRTRSMQVVSHINTAWLWGCRTTRLTCCTPASATSTACRAPPSR